MTIAERRERIEGASRPRPLTAFVSYRRLDAAEVQGVERALRLRGVRTWRDVNDLHLGGATEQEIVRALGSESDAYLLYATPRIYAADSTFIWDKEMPAADARWRLERYPVIALYRETDPDDFTARCRALGLTDFGTEANGEWIPERGAMATPEAVRAAQHVIARRVLRTLLSRHASSSVVMTLRTFEQPDLAKGTLLDLDWRGVLERADPEAWTTELFPALRDIVAELESAGIAEATLYAHARLSLCVAFGAALPLASRVRLRLMGREGEWKQLPEGVRLQFRRRSHSNGMSHRALVVLGLSRGVDASGAELERQLTPKHVSIADVHASDLARNVRPIAQSVGDELRALASQGVRDFHLVLAAPAPLAVAIGRQLHALGRMSLYYADEHRMPARAFTLQL